MEDDGGRRTAFAHQRSYSCGDISPTDTDRDNDEDSAGDQPTHIASTSTATADVNYNEDQRRQRDASRETGLMDTGELCPGAGGGLVVIGQ